MKRYIFGLLILIAFNTENVLADFATGAIAPPEYKSVDDFDVDLINGQVRPGLETLSIGGDMGLTHRITLEGNHFQHAGSWGYTDAFSGNASFVNVGAELYIDQDTRYEGPLPIYLMRVFGPQGTHDFGAYQGGNLIRDPRSMQSGFVYKSIGETGDTLDDVGGYLIWTNSKGIVSRYLKNGSGLQGKLVDITYPNGFKIEIGTLKVTTNTGFRLIYSVGSWGSIDDLVPAKKSIYENLVNEGRAPANSGGWDRNPKSIKGINLAVENCTDECDQNWPLAEFEWEQGAPVAYEIGDSIFRVKDAFGGVTDYHYRAFNACEVGSGISQICSISNPDPWTSRLIGIKSAQSKVIDREYSYTNEGFFESYSTIGDQLSFWQMSSKTGLISTARNRDRWAFYRPLSHADNTSGSVNTYFRSNSNRDTAQVRKNTRSHLNMLVLNEGDLYYFETNARNFVKSHTSAAQVSNYYHYDSRGNVTKVVRTPQLATSENSFYNDCGNIDECSVVQADFQVNCVNPKTCNQPNWVDLNGDRTYYTYHPESGLINTVTGPEVHIEGVAVRPKTTYGYTKLFAYYKNESNVIQKATTGIWMLTSEFKCMTSNATESGCEAGFWDKVETNYNYGPQDGSPNNLLLRGVSVTAFNSFQQISTRVTCFQYDERGNRIGETAPRASHNLYSCQ